MFSILNQDFLNRLIEVKTMSPCFFYLKYRLQFSTPFHCLTLFLLVWLSIIVLSILKCIKISQIVTWGSQGVPRLVWRSNRPTQSSSNWTDQEHLVLLASLADTRPIRVLSIKGTATLLPRFSWRIELLFLSVEEKPAALLRKPTSSARIHNSVASSLLHSHIFRVLKIKNI